MVETQNNLFSNNFDKSGDDSYAHPAASSGGFGGAASSTDKAAPNERFVSVPDGGFSSHSSRDATGGGAYTAGDGLGSRGEGEGFGGVGVGDGRKDVGAAEKIASYGGVKTVGQGGNQSSTDYAKLASHQGGGTDEYTYGDAGGAHSGAAGADFDTNAAYGAGAAGLGAGVGAAGVGSAVSQKWEASTEKTQNNTGFGGDNPYTNGTGYAGTAIASGANTTEPAAGVMSGRGSEAGYGIDSHAYGNSTGADYTTLVGAGAAGAGAGEAANKFAQDNQHKSGSKYTGDAAGAAGAVGAAGAAGGAGAVGDKLGQKLDENTDKDGFSNVTGDKEPGYGLTGRAKVDQENPENTVVETTKQRSERDDQGRELDSYGKPYDL
ncbi:hypothetical protein MNV49_004463 [Pseudohyphozyma bogoriensis]|nr:hypothetical protein MNV49_004463 [Pseudohyphozyma bogoriensis]